MNMNFDNIEYLQHGNDRQRQASALNLTGDPYMELLKFEMNGKSPNR